jgi:hypothetical protein
VKNQEIREIKTRTGRIWIEDDGIVRSMADTGSHETLKDAIENMAAIARVSAGIKRPLLVDLTKAGSIERAARTYYTSPEAAAHYLAVAIVANSPIGRVIGNFFLGLNKTPAPSKLFGEHTDALTWLRGFPNDLK